MAFVKSFLTMQGLALASKLVQAPQDLKITRVLGGDGSDPGQALSDRTGLQNPSISFETNEGIRYLEPDQIQIPIYYENSSLLQTLRLSEIGLFAKDPDEGEILFAIAVSYDDPLALPRLSEGRLELTCNFTLQLSLTPDITISLPSSVVYLTKPEADKLYWRIGTKYPATEITETVGYTTEEWQRHQDAEIALMREQVASGTRSAQQVEIGSREPLLWKIVDSKGWYDKTLAAYRAGGKIPPLPEPGDPPVEPEPEPEEEETTPIGRPPGGLTLGKR